MEAPLEALPAAKAGNPRFRVVLSLPKDPMALPALLDQVLQLQSPAGGGILKVESAMLRTAGQQGKAPGDGPPAQVLFIVCRSASEPRALRSALERAIFGATPHRPAVMVEPGAADMESDEGAGFASTPCSGMDPSSDFTVAVMQLDVLDNPCWLSMALETAILNGLHIAGMRVVYLSTQQAVTLSHHSRHHPEAGAPLAALLLQGKDAVARWQAACGPANLPLALSSAPGSLHGRMAAAMEGPVPAKDPVVTTSRDADTVAFEAAFLFGGRLGGRLEEHPPRGWAPPVGEPPLVTLAPRHLLWLLLPADDQAALLSALQVLQSLDARGFGLQRCRRSLMDQRTAERLAATGEFGAAALGAGGYLAAAVSCQGAPKAVAHAMAAVEATLSAPSGALLGNSGGGREASTILRELGDAEGESAGQHLPDGSPPYFDEEGAPLPSDIHAGKTVAVVAFRGQPAAGSLGALRHLLGEGLEAARQGVGAGGDATLDLISLELLALRRLPSLKAAALPFLWPAGDPAQDRSAQARQARLREPLLLALLRGTDAGAYLRAALRAETAAAAPPVHRRRRSSLQDAAPLSAMLAVSSGEPAAALARAFFSDADLVAGAPSPRDAGPVGLGLLEAALAPPPPELTTMVVDAASLRHGLLDRVLRLAGRHGFRLAGLAMLPLGEAAAAATLGLAGVAWRWDEGAAAAAPGVVVWLERPAAAICCLQMLSASPPLLPREAVQRGWAAAAGLSPGEAPVAVAGHGLAVLAGGALPPLPTAPCGARQRAVERLPGGGDGGMLQSACLALLPYGGSPQEALRDVALAVEGLREDGFQIANIVCCPATAAMAPLFDSAADRRLLSQRAAAGGDVVAFAVARINAPGRLQMLISGAATSARGRRGEQPLKELRDRVLLSMSASHSDKQLAHFFDRLHCGPAQVVAAQPKS